MAVVNDSRSISLTWMAPEIINGRLLMYVLTTLNGDNVISTVNITDVSSTVELLDPFVLYTFRVVAVTGAGPGPGAEITATTDQAGKNDGYSKLLNLDVFISICSTFTS